ncbi:MAG: dTMP kinase [Planctomycetota bacterium]|jgi:dTMP kinase
MPGWPHTLAGRFVVFDGPDGSGKTTQFNRFAGWCRDEGVDLCEVREPGGTVIGEQIRAILLDPAHAEMGVRCETMLYMASRAQLVEQVIEPALKRGQLVLADRFVSSTLAYQGTAGGMSAEEIMSVGRVAVGRRWPDVVVVFDVDEATGARRLGGGGTAGPGEPTLFSDRIERKQFQFRQRVREGFLEQAADPPFGEYLLVDGSRDPDTVFTALVDGLRRHLAG